MSWVARPDGTEGRDGGALHALPCRQGVPRKPHAPDIDYLRSNSRLIPPHF